MAGTSLDSEDLGLYYSAPIPVLAQHFSQKYGGIDAEKVIYLTRDAALNYYQNEVEVRTGVCELVQELHGQGYLLAVASASPQIYLEAGLKRVGLAHYFSHIVSSNDWEMHKSDAEFYRKICKLMDVDCHHSWGIDDSAVALKAMHAAGLSTIGIHDPLNDSCTFSDLKAVADIAIHDFSDLPDGHFSKQGQT